MILLAPLLTIEAASTLPDHTAFVALHANTPMAGVTNIETDEEAGMYRLVHHLITLGHRRIMHLSGAHGLIGAERRIAGWRRALQEADIPVDPELLVEASFASGFGRRVFAAWLDDHRGQRLPQAIACGNDAIAVEVLEVLASRGIRVPDDVSVTGFDDTLGARTSVPQLTTVRQPLREMGRRAVEVLLDHISTSTTGPRTPPPPIVFPAEVMLRASIGPAAVSGSSIS